MKTRESPMSHPPLSTSYKHSTTSKKMFIIKDRNGQVVGNVQRCLLYCLLGDCISG